MLTHANAHAYIHACLHARMHARMNADPQASTQAHVESTPVFLLMRARVLCTCIFVRWVSSVRSKVQWNILLHLAANPRGRLHHTRSLSNKPCALIRAFGVVSILFKFSLAAKYSWIERLAHTLMRSPTCVHAHTRTTECLPQASCKNGILLRNKTRLACRPIPRTAFFLNGCILLFFLSFLLAFLFLLLASILQVL